jgi:hypothetical protein
MPHTTVIACTVGTSMLLSCNFASAQQPPASAKAMGVTAPSSVPEEATNKLARDLANLHRQIEEARQQAKEEARQQTAEEARQRVGYQEFNRSIGSGAPMYAKQIEVTRDAQIRGGADSSAPTEFTAPKGANFVVLDKANDFYAVAGSLGRTGWVSASDVKPRISVSTPALASEWTGVPANKPSFVYHDTSGPINLLPEQEAAPLTVTERVYKTITDSAFEFRTSYENNPYFQVTGFTVSLGLIPSLDITFTFR